MTSLHHALVAAVILHAGCSAAPPAADGSVVPDASSLDGGPLHDASLARHTPAVPASDAGTHDAPIGRRDAASSGGRDAGPACGSGLVGGSRGVVNDDPRFVSVFVNNVENLKERNETCRGDWRDLLFYMRAARPQPDIFVLQQISNRAQLDQLVAAMNAQLRGTYAGIIAEANPRRMGSPCGAEKAQQTNAIIYRTERFTPLGDRHTWQSYAMIGGTCRRSGLARTMYVMHRFRDRVAARDVNVVSMHWSTNDGDGADPACAERNIADLDETAHRAAFRSDLLLIGGDTNEPDRLAGGAFRDWYRSATGELSYTDPVLDRCRSADDRGVCLDNNWTIGSARRIDFLFAQTGSGCEATTGHAHTVTFDEADAAARALTGSDSALNYSDHRAVHAEVYYAR